MEDVLSFSDSKIFFAHVFDTAFWNDKARVQVLIELYGNFECSWNVKGVEYNCTKNVTNMKRAKE